MTTTKEIEEACRQLRAEVGGYCTIQFVAAGFDATVGNTYKVSFRAYTERGGWGVESATLPEAVESARVAASSRRLKIEKSIAELQKQLAEIE